MGPGAFSRYFRLFNENGNREDNGQVFSGDCLYAKQVLNINAPQILDINVTQTSLLMTNEQSICSPLLIRRVIEQKSKVRFQDTILPIVWVQNYGME